MKGRTTKLAKKMVLFLALLQIVTGCSIKSSDGDKRYMHPVELRSQEVHRADKEAGSYDERTTVALRSGDQCIELSLRQYLIGVLHGELPSSFSLETMKAQAVAARTVAIKKMKQGKELCDDPNCCQAYRNSAVENPNIVTAVLETDGQVLIYDAELIEATYFSCSGGMTEAAVDVWGNEVEYLQAVSSPGEEDAPRYEEVITLSSQSFRQILQDEVPELPGDLQISEPVRTAGGGVRSIEIDGVTFTGTQLRRMFSLRSTCFEITENGQIISIRSLGYGHRVGMSQYGAQAMAELGANYREILSYYYQGTEIKKQS